MQTKSIPPVFPYWKGRRLWRRKSPSRFCPGQSRKSFLAVFGTAVLLCLHTGLRLGELCALKWEDLDLENRTLTVNRTVQRIAVKGYRTKTVLMETDPKSESSRRTIPLTEEMAGLLARLDTGRPYVFGGEKPSEPRTMQYRFRKILGESGIDSRKFHTLCGKRHGCEVFK